MARYFDFGVETSLPTNHGWIGSHMDNRQPPWDPIHLIHIYKGKGRQILDSQHEVIIIEILSHLIVSRGHLYTPEDHLGVLVPTNALKALIFKYVNLRRPSIINDATENLPNLGKSLYHNILEYNFPAISGVVRLDTVSYTHLTLPTN